MNYNYKKSESAPVYICPMCPGVKENKPGKCPHCGMDLILKLPKKEEKVISESESAAGTVYSCPMHPEIQRERPGMCPECGMQLVPAALKQKKSADAKVMADKHAGHSTQIFLRKFFVSFALTIP